MELKKKKNSKFYLLSSTLGLGLLVYAMGYSIAFGENKDSEVEKKSPTLEVVHSDNKKFRTHLDQVFLKPNDWPKQTTIDNKPHLLDYTFNEQLNNFVRAQLRQYKTDYSTIVVIDNETGNVLAAQGYLGSSKKFDQSLVLAATHPSASLIKIITAADLVGKGNVTKETPFEFLGRSTTLFKYQLTDGRRGPSRAQSFETAFAKSNNVIFGKAAIKHSSPNDLVKTAEEWGFNVPLLSEVSSVSQIKTAEDNYEFAELASGFNTTTTITPIHGAVMSAIIANDGILKNPKLLASIKRPNSNDELWEKTEVEKRVMTPKVAEELRTMMVATIEDGTARKQFRKMNRGFRDVLEIGGKTGSITGGKPFGKRDWFTAYAMPKDRTLGKGISIAVMNVNVKRWHVKSSFLAKNIIEYYYRNVKTIPITLAAPEPRKYRTKKKFVNSHKARRYVASKPSQKKKTKKSIMSAKEKKERQRKL